MRSIIGINVLGVAVVAAISTIALVLQPEDVCIDQGTVAEITALNYRSATIRLTDGRTREVDQASLKPGDPFCMKRGRKPS